jgi:hypothetical protein
MVNEAEQERFWAKVDRRGPDDCWLWTATRLPAGYGRVGDGYAHHLALKIDGRARPPGAIALHSCDNPPCVNPAHLRWGTYLENNRDALNKGRNPHHGRHAGEKNGNAKLDETAVRAIRADGRTNPQVAADYGISRELVSHIRNGRAWRHVA